MIKQNMNTVFFHVIYPVFHNSESGQLSRMFIFLNCFISRFTFMQLAYQYSVNTGAQNKDTKYYATHVIKVPICKVKIFS